jgi:hypothetical protein
LLFLIAVSLSAFCGYFLADGIEILLSTYSHAAAQVEQGLGEGLDQHPFTLENEGNPITLVYFDAAAHFTGQGDPSTPPDTGFQHSVSLSDIQDFIRHFYFT